ncbi:uncharacterized protein PAC_01594 [Phialocephala subalpina]|uniref:2EXR domain-containing protein n=1 Tax=Phialocephala subalpina TaxID=576137 RepID=A0A1L7WG25_9HELO|nr:uncharacterized protein PAC_01594 [Phialocephala subalpina]
MNHSHTKRAIMFSRFSELSLELRCIIWGFALTEPQIHIVKLCSAGIMPRHRYSRTNVIMQTCKEARNEGFKLMLPYFLINNLTCAWDDWPFVKDPTSKTYVRSFINNAEDILWISSRGLFPEKLYCSKCDPSPHTRNDMSWVQIRDECHCHCPPGLGTIAMNWSCLFPRIGRVRLRWSVARLWEHHRVQKVYVVVNNSKHVHERNVEFVEASWPPRSSEGLLLAEADMKDWNEVAKATVSSLENRKVMLMGNGRALLDTGTALDEKTTPDISSWSIPSIEFVETRAVPI